MRFFLIDRITNWEVPVDAETIKNVALSEDFFDDHFPRRPIMPGVPMLEGMAQLSGLLLEASLREKFQRSAKAILTVLERFGRVALRRIRPVLSFKILSNMPICFVSIFEGVRGPNAVYTPWEGQGAQAIAAGIRAIRRGDVPCALVGGCDVKTHELALVSLQQLGVFGSWIQHGRGTPGST